MLGYFLKKNRWPRPPFVIGLVLGPIAEDSLHKALGIWGPTFFLRPQSLVMIVLIIGSVAFYVWRQRTRKPVTIGYEY